MRSACCSNCAHPATINDDRRCKAAITRTYMHPFGWSRAYAGPRIFDLKCRMRRPLTLLLVVLAAADGDSEWDARAPQLLMN